MQVAQKLRCVAVRDRHDGNARDASLSGRDSRGTGTTRCAGGRRIAGTIEDTAALDPVRWTHRTGGVHVAANVAVVLRIAVDEQRRRAVPLRFTRLDAP